MPELKGSCLDLYLCNVWFPFSIVPHLYLDIVKPAPILSN